MEWLTAVSLVLLSLSLEIACEQRLEDLRDVWFEAIMKSNESFYRRKEYPDDFRNLVDQLSSIRLKSGYEQRNLFGELRNVMLNNSREKKFGFKFGIFTNFCGPGNVANDTVCGSFNGVDECCKSHDRCEHVISKQSDYNSYPNLPKKPLYFTSLSCECDSAFYNCIKRTESIFGDVILSVYSVAQMSCFQLDHKIEKCTKFDEYLASQSLPVMYLTKYCSSWIFRKRCLQYKANNQTEKRWQWFDLPYSSVAIKEYLVPRLMF